MNADLKFTLIASFGAICQEFIYWWELRNKLQNIKYKRLIKSYSYWLIVVGLIVISGLGTYILCFEDGISRMQIPFIIGAAFPTLFKKAVQMRANQDLGSNELNDFGSITKIYFQS